MGQPPCTTATTSGNNKQGMNSAEPLKFVRILCSTILMQENVEVGSARKYKYSYQANLEQILTSVTRRTSCTLKG